jgi:hypothetical protein
MHFILSFKYNIFNARNDRSMWYVVTGQIKLAVGDGARLSVLIVMYTNGMNSTKKAKKELSFLQFVLWLVHVSVAGSPRI